MSARARDTVTPVPEAALNAVQEVVLRLGARIRIVCEDIGQQRFPTVFTEHSLPPFVPALHGENLLAAARSFRTRADDVYNYLRRNSTKLYTVTKRGTVSVLLSPDYAELYIALSRGRHTGFHRFVTDSSFPPARFFEVITAIFHSPL
jgi:hypothetical protein